MVTRRVMGQTWGMVSVGLCVALLAAGCGGGGGATKPDDAITAEGILEDVRALSADEFEGRAPGTTGEEKTVAYLTRRFREIGLEPGNPDGTFIQQVPLIAFRSTATGFFDVGGQRTTLAAPVDWVPVARQGLPAVTVDRSAVVFVGYGVEAPEFRWDDFKGHDLRGKTIVMLVGDPPVPDPDDPSRLDAATFKGPAMTYYGRWAYKYEVAARKGAAAAILVHETGPAGYPFDVVQASWARENLGLAGPDEAARHAIIDAWITLDRARELFASAGHSYDDLKARAVSRAFEPVDLGTTFSASVTNAIRRVETSNVIARLPGRDPAVRDEHVMYSAHWDSFGRNTSLEGDQIINGALDNGSGMATMLAIAEAFAAMPEPPRRSLLFLSPTAEEAGMVGSAYYADHPLWPLERTLADINMDIMNFWGRAAAIVSIGHGMTTLDDLLASAATEQGRVVLPDPEPEKGYFYRSDHIHLARRGVPALHFLHPGAEYRDRPPGYGQQMRDRYTTQDYHKVTDEVKSDWDLAGAVEDARLLFAVGRMVADGEVWPEWKAGTEFRAIREAARKR